MAREIAESGGMMLVTVLNGECGRGLVQAEVDSGTGGVVGKLVRW